MLYFCLYFVNNQGINSKKKSNKENANNIDVKKKIIDDVNAGIH